MARSLAVLLLVASVALPGAVRPLSAQARAAQVPVPPPLMAIARNDLSFGTVLAGVPAVVEVHDHRKAGLFEIQGPADASVRVEFVVPDALVSSDGSRLQLLFGPQDGFADFSMGRPPRGTYFHPSNPLVSSLGPNGRLYVHLGGSAYPTRVQPSGTYRATIYLTVYDLGS